MDLGLIITLLAFAVIIAAAFFIYIKPVREAVEEKTGKEDYLVLLIIVPQIPTAPILSIHAFEQDSYVRIPKILAFPSIPFLCRPSSAPSSNLALA